MFDQHPRERIRTVSYFNLYFFEVHVFSQYSIHLELINVTPFVYLYWCYKMATKLKTIMPPVIPISQRSPFSGEKGDGQQLIRRKVKSSSSRRPKLSVRSKKQFSSSKTKNLKKRQTKKIQSENPSTGNQEQAAWDSISPLDPMNCENRKLHKKAKKKRISFKV